MFVNSLFPDKFQEIATRCYTQSTESYNKLFTDVEFYKNVMDVMAGVFYKEFRNKQGNDSLRLFKDRVGRIWGNVAMPCKTTCLAFIIH